jgi:hypothetical protein
VRVLVSHSKAAEIVTGELITLRGVGYALPDLRLPQQSLIASRPIYLLTVTYLLTTEGWMAWLAIPGLEIKFRSSDWLNTRVTRSAWPHIPT